MKNFTEKQKFQLKVTILLQMERTKTTFDWTRIPFFTLLEILWHLTPCDIKNLREAYPCVEDEYTQLNEWIGHKFVFDSRVDEIDILFRYRKIRKLFINLRPISRQNHPETLIPITLQSRLNDLKILDNNHLMKSFAKEVLQIKFKHLTIITIEALPEFSMIHNITPLINCCENLQELSYCYGNLYEKDIEKLKELESLKLKNVFIQNTSKFEEFFMRTKNKLHTLYFYQDRNVTFELDRRIPKLIFECLPILLQLKNLTITAFDNTYAYENLDKLSHLEKLTIIAQTNSYLPNLYIAMSQIIVKEVYIEEWNFRFFPLLYDTQLMNLKVKSIRHMVTYQPEVRYSIYDSETEIRYVLKSK